MSVDTRRRPTIRHVADRAGVSPTTVSYVLNRKGTISEETAQRVLVAARELGYAMPEAIPATAIAVLYPPVVQEIKAHEFYAGFVNGIERATSMLSNVTITYAPNDPGHFLFQHAMGASTQGILVFGADEDDPGVQQALALGKPCVLLNHRGEKASSVCVAHREAMYDLTRHLVVDHGCPRVAYVQSTDTSYARERLAGYRDALASAGVPWDEAPLVSFAGDVPALVEALLSIVDLQAMVIDRGSIASRLVQELEARRIHLPERIRLAAFDDIKPLAKANVTTVRFDPSVLAEHATNLLLACLRGEILKAQIDMPYEIIRRRTCGCDSRPSS